MRRIRVVRAAPLTPLLRWADIVIAHRSSVLLDALAMGTPAVIPALDGPMLDSGEYDLPVPRPADVAELTRSIVDFEDVAVREAFFNRIRGDLERVAGPSDGRSATRIAGDLLVTSGIA
jgi:hypothetical protein